MPPHEAAALTDAQACVLEVARSLARREQPKIVLSSHLTVEALLGASIQQKMEGCMASALLETTDLGNNDRRRIVDLLSAMESSRAYYLDRALEIQQALMTAGVPTLARKGLVYDSIGYGARGLRKMGDLDFHVQARHSTKVPVILGAVGYKPCEPRKTIILRRLRPDHLPRLKRNPTNGEAPVVEVDFALSLCWYGCEFWASLEHALEPRFVNQHRDGGTGLYTLSPDEHFLDCCLHLFREGYFEEEGNLAGTIQAYPYALSVRQFVDVARLWDSLCTEERDNVVRALEIDGLQHAVVWSVFHTDTVLDTNLMRQMNLTIDPHHAYSWRQNNGMLGSWSGSMINRLFSNDPISIFGLHR